MSARAGAEVGLYMDSRDEIEVGDALVSNTTGRAYLVMSVRVQQRGDHIGRQHVRAIVFNHHFDLPPDHGKLLRFAWYTRPRRK